MKTNFIVATITTITLMMSSCSKPTLVTTSDNGNPMTFSVEGDALTVKLKGNSTTGYQWTSSVNNDEKVVKKTTDEYAVETRNGRPMMGGGGVHTFVFEAAHSGSAKITFEYARPDGGESAGVRILKVKVDDKLKVSASEASR